MLILTLSLQETEVGGGLGGWQWKVSVPKHPWLQFFEVHLQGLEFPRASPCPTSSVSDSNPCLVYSYSLPLTGGPSSHTWIFCNRFLNWPPCFRTLLPPTQPVCSCHIIHQSAISITHIRTANGTSCLAGQLQPSQPHLICCFPFIGLSVLQVPWPYGLSSLS